MANWYYYDKNGYKIGPVKGRDLNRLAQEGTIVPETRVEDENGRTALAKNVKGLSFYEARESESNPFSGNMSSVVAPLPPDQPIPPPFVPPPPPPPLPPPSPPFAVHEGHVPPHYGGQQPGYQSPGCYPMREKTPGIFDFGFTRFITNTWISFIWSNTVIIILLCWGIAVLNGLVAILQGGDFFIVGLGIIFLATIVAALNLLFARMALEFIIVVFRIETRVRTMEKHCEVMSLIEEHLRVIRNEYENK